MINLECKNSRTVFLAFVTEDSFYFEKPYNQKSIMYLMIRFLGDLCQDIILLYDKKIEIDFDEKNCPYAISENQFHDY